VLLCKSGRPVPPETLEVLHSFEQEVLEEMNLAKQKKHKDEKLLMQIVKT